MKRAFLLIIFLTEISFAQDIPHLHDGIFQITQFVSSEKFCELKLNNDDLSQIDSIYNYALRIYQDDHSEAMLALTFALLPYNEMDLKLPIIGIDWNVPLPHSADSVYLLKNENLPKYIFSDSPKDNFGDRDKLSHFFGNAFLSFNISLFNFSEFIGIFIELFEESFKIEGALDERDLIANELGKRFGEALQDNKNIKPSDFFRKYDEILQLLKNEE